METLREVIAQGIIDKALIEIITKKDGVKLIAEKYEMELEELRNKTDREIHTQIMKGTFPDLTDEHIAKCMNRVYGEVA